MSDKAAVLLLQMGGPDSLDAVEPFLLNLFSDRDIIRIGPAFLQPFIARLIAKRRSPSVERKYEEIGGKSPIRELTESQARALEEVLGDGYRCFVAMRYWKPSTMEALAAIRREGISRVIALSLYPHYSRATTGSSVNELKRVLSQSGVQFQMTYVDRFFDHPLYIDALAEKVQEGLDDFHPLAEVQILFSAHSLPQSFIDEGDPYLDHIRETVRLVMERFEGVTHHLAFQSRAGPVKWLEPSTDEMLEHLAAHQVKNLLIVPLSFVSDHIETLHEIDIEYAQEAHKLGYSRFRRSPSLNASPTFISCLADLVRKATEDHG
ncbi:ferrochelatase [Geobacter anodireducens]|uniref:Ferrochelatase n=1 Tax=Geobacter anodireducens TaxID=1340425 RepID=A0ABR9NZJ0_9BACT|nr:ferrochelatase [Geobacter anodireducens]MBE2889686.1 ferrochelatase [Geobacter anodireducens]HMN03389.1 ferrochelatase [Geobacter anodireducens]